MLEVNKVSKGYGGEAVLRGADLRVERGEFVTLTGASGAGKSTLVNLIMGAERPDSGSVWFEGRRVDEMRSGERQVYRRKLGVVFQDYRLLPQKTVWENVAFALEVGGVGSEEIGKKVPEMLAKMGLMGKEGLFPGALSGGEQQRVAIARALVHEPKLILADEPTGNLDMKNAKGIVELLKKINEEMGVTVLLTTHDPMLLKWLGKRVMEIKEGKIWEKVGEGVEITLTMLEEVF